jgi:hypothetical protein
MRLQIRRQQKEILTLQRSGISTASAELLLVRRRASVDTLCTKRDQLVRELCNVLSSRANGVM